MTGVIPIPPVEVVSQAMTGLKRNQVLNARPPPISPEEQSLPLVNPLLSIATKLQLIDSAPTAAHPVNQQLTHPIIYSTTPLFPRISVLLTCGSASSRSPTSSQIFPSSAFLWGGANPRSTSSPPGCPFPSSPRTPNDSEPPWGKRQQQLNWSYRSRW